jgi:hypothetical protein
MEARMNFNRRRFGGLLSFLAFVAAAIFFGILMFNGSISDWPLEAIGFFCLALAFVLERLGY